MSTPIDRDLSPTIGATHPATWDEYGSTDWQPQNPEEDPQNPPKGLSWMLQQLRSLETLQATT